MPAPKAPTRTEPAPTVTLADLDPETRAALLREAEQARIAGLGDNPRQVPGYEELSLTDKAVRALHDTRHHVADCPVQLGDELGRIEGFNARVPPDRARGIEEHYVAVIRCLNCGGQTVRERPLSAELADVIPTLQGATTPSGPGEDDLDGELT